MEKKSKRYQVSCSELENGRFALVEDMYELAKKDFLNGIGKGSKYQFVVKIVRIKNG